MHTYSIPEEGFGYNYRWLKKFSELRVSLNDGAKEVDNGEEF